MRVINLDTEHKTLKIRLGAAHATNPLLWTSHYYDSLPTNIDEINADGETNGADNVTIVAAPAAGVKRVVKDMSVYNADTQAHTLYLILDDDGTEYIIRVYSIGIAQSRTLDAPIEIEGVDFWETESPTTIRPTNSKLVDGQHLTGTIDCGIFQP